MTSSVSGQDEPNLALSLATRARKMKVQCILSMQALQKKKQNKKEKNDAKKELGQYLGILTSRLANNPYILIPSTAAFNRNIATGFRTVTVRIT